ncbi:MAG: pteridine reductase [Gammaproteobacteria bacterium]|nr:pteridine reductase [Gammaproteobacteria bacterium]
MQSDNDSLHDKVALVTGAGRRVGAEIARKLHAEGARIVLHYRSSDRDAHALQSELNDIREESAVLVQCDLLQYRKLQTLIRQAHAVWGRLDILVNNASSFYPTPIFSADEDQWDDLIGTNLKAPYFLSQAAAPMLREWQGNIINITDIHADRPLKDHSIYCIAKAGLVMMTRSLARELAPEIRVNGIAPGAVLWPENGIDEVTRQRITTRTALKRAGSPEDIAKTVIFLVRDADYITGQIIAVDGGRTLSH